TLPGTQYKKPRSMSGVFYCLTFPQNQPLPAEFASAYSLRSPVSSPVGAHELRHRRLRLLPRLALHSHQFSI
ncbi:hypothetical protein, partial [Aeromonas media]|uniref:hypothetical protein n=1 Tax=Aeromonas media TaxID=651 RepID=UPI0019D55956